MCICYVDGKCGYNESRKESKSVNTGSNHSAYESPEMADIFILCLFISAMYNLYDFIHLERIKNEVQSRIFKGFA